MRHGILAPFVPPPKEKDNNNNNNNNDNIANRERSYIMGCRVVRVPEEDAKHMKLRFRHPDHNYV